MEWKRERSERGKDDGSVNSAEAIELAIERIVARAVAMK